MYTKSKNINMNINKKLINLLEKYNGEYKIKVISTIRSAEEQYKLYQKKATKCDGYKKKSKHQSGNAFDFAVIINNRINWEPKYYIKVVEEFKKIDKNLIFGADWKNFKDFGHVET